MIIVGCPEINRVNFEWHLMTEWGASLRGLITQVTYEEIFAGAHLPRGSWVMTGLDQLTPAGREAAGMVADQLIAAGMPLLNHPARVRLRHDLLDDLYRLGLNRFRSARAIGYHGDLRFPVFVREEHRHTGNLTAVLKTEDELQRALLQLRLRGFALEELLIVEFCDTSQDGVFTKYSVYNVNGHLLARNKQCGPFWMVKSSLDRTDAQMMEQNDYIRENPHRDTLARIFSLAGIEYGRADFGVLDGAVQVWEINTAPTINAAEDSTSTDPVFLHNQMVMRPGLSFFFDGFQRAFTDFSGQSAEGPAIRCTLPATLVADWRVEARRRAGFLRRRQWMTSIASNQAVGTLVRATAPALRRALHRLGW